MLRLRPSRLSSFAIPHYDSEAREMTSDDKIQTRMFIQANTRMSNYHDRKYSNACKASRSAKTLVGHWLECALRPGSLARNNIRRWALHILVISRHTLSRADNSYLQAWRWDKMKDGNARHGSIQATGRILSFSVIMVHRAHAEAVVIQDEESCF